jgi:glycosyltransferase involved in cell wall biosynthesis
MIGCVRTGKTASHLQRLGHDVRVVTAKEQGLPLRTLPLEMDPSRVTATSWFGPRRVLDIFSRNSGSPASGEGDATVASIGKRLFRGILYFPDPQGGWIPGAVRAGARIIKKWRPDIIFASSGPPSSLVVASILSRTFSIPWVGDLRDLWVDTQNYVYPGWRKPIDFGLQRAVLSSAAGLVTVSQPLADQLTKFGVPVEVILNGYDDADYANIEARPGTTAQLRIVYTGTIYPQQSAEPLFRALALLGADAARVKVDFIGSPSAAVLPVAAEMGVSRSVEVLPQQPRKSALAEQLSADVLLHLLWNDTSQTGVYNAKIFEYLRARRPVLGVGSTENITAQLIRDRNAGIATNDPSVIAGQLKMWLSDLSRGVRPAALAADSAAGFSRAEQTAKLSGFLTTLTASSGVEAARQ